MKSRNHIQRYISCFATGVAFVMVGCGGGEKEQAYDTNLLTNGSFERQVEEGFRCAIGRYNLACSRALSGQTDKALEMLEDLVETGQVVPATMERDPDLRALHADPRWARLVRPAGRT